MLTEKGAQSGAITATRFSNIRITNLDDLRTNANTDLLDLQWNRTFARAAETSHRLSTLWTTVIPNRPGVTASSQLKPGVDWDEYVRFQSRLSAAEDGLSRARLGRFPAPYDMEVADAQNPRYLGADSLEKFISGATKTLGDVEAWVQVQTEKPWAIDQPAAGTDTSGDSPTEN